MVGEFAPRFYRVLYASLLAPEFRRSSKNNLYLNLLYRVLKTCKNRRIVMALLKRVLQCALMMPANMACGLLYMVSTVLSERKELKVNAELKKLMEEHAFDLGMEEEKGEGEEKEEEKEEEMKEEGEESEKEEVKEEEDSEKEDSDDDDDESEEEEEEEEEVKEEKEESKAMEEEEGDDEVADLDEAFFQDSDDQSENEKEHESESEEEEKKKENSDHESDAEQPVQPAAPASSPLPSVVYDIHARDPIFSNADRTFLFELSLLAHHYHPTVAHFANQLLDGSRVFCSGDPLIDFSNKAFLDKFAYKHPKQKDLDNARDRGSEVMQSHKKAKSLTQPPVNSEAFLNQKEEDVAIEDQFFYKFFKERAKRTGDKKKSKKGTEEEGEDNDEEEEIDEFANQLATDLINEHMGEEADDFLNEFEEEENGRFLEEGRNDGGG